MLDTDTKRRIDTARDILVGKVPDPKSQVEQITIALIYKFMDDMDAESEEFGGKRKFFAGDFARYGWAKLMRSGLGGHETLNLYAEAIARMPENPGIPPLFRDIFKNAYLPYRDPETLRAFLKVIDEFTYDHSERLGDAFEYLLSVLGSQGDAGQFRTPRHIIDFIVEIVDPKKNETVLDPACGTAGFLISAYKHILAANRIDVDAQDTNNTSYTSRASMLSALTPEEKGRLAQSFRGYDISPDMVRLSLANMYLHGFADPHIYEYDTLTSLDRWNEYADVILANPPFMSPKGGIRPHNRFSVQSKRSEVLFVDYIAEHLTPTGRAGIIVPEGVIFQSGTAYKQLRKMLVEDYLVAVISLPAGVFNPYSGVKTSILILDKSLAKRTNTIAFFKVENDGFSLGAQRREIDQNDLPQALAEIGEYLRRLRAGESVVGFEPSLGLIVPREKVAANGEYNLSGERYREGPRLTNAFPLAELGAICTINPRKDQVAHLSPDIRVSFVPMSSLREHSVEFRPTEERQLSEVLASHTYFADNDVLLAKVTPCFENGKAGVARGLVNGIGFGSSEFYVLRPSQRVLPEWLYFSVMRPSFRRRAIAQMTGTGGLQRVPKAFLEGFQIPLPPLEVQKEIVAEIEGYQKVIDGARAVVENYCPHIAIDPEWPLVAIGDLVDSVLLGLVKNKAEQDSRHGVPYIKMNNITGDGSLNLADLAYVPATDDEILRYSLSDGDFIYNTRNAPNLVGKSAVFHGESGKYLFSNNILRIRFGPRAHPDYVNIIMNSEYGKAKIRSLVDGTTSVAAVYQKNYLSIQIPLPPLAIQQAIVAEIEAERALVNANRELIARFERKIQAVLARVWGEADGDTIGTGVRQGD